MKAKEIAKRIHENFGVDGADAFDALSVELIADLLRFNEDVKNRKIGVHSGNDATQRIGLQAWMRLANEYNTKWRSVVRQFSGDPRFSDSRGPYFDSNIFVTALASSVFEGLPREHVDETVRQILSVSTTPATAKFDIQRSVWRMQEEQDMRKQLYSMMWGRKA